MVHLLVAKGGGQGGAVPPVLLAAAIDGAVHGGEGPYGGPTCGFCGCPESVWCGHELLWVWWLVVDALG